MFTEDMIDQMRRELENPELMKSRIKEEKAKTKFIENTRKLLAEDGRDLDVEFDEYMKTKEV